MEHSYVAIGNMNEYVGLVLTLLCLTRKQKCMAAITKECVKEKFVHDLRYVKFSRFTCNAVKG